MKNAAYIFSGVALVAALVAIVLYFLVQGKLAEKQEQLEATQTNLAETESALSNAERRVAELESEVKELEGELTDANDEVRRAKAQFAQARSNISDLQNDLRSAQDKVTDLQTNNEELRREIKDLVTDQPQIDVEEIDNLRRDKERFQERIADLEQEIDRLKSQGVRVAGDTAGNTLGSAGIRTADQTGSDGTPSGLDTATVVQANSSRGLLVLDRGGQDGLEAGETLRLAKGLDRPITVRINRVQPSMSVAAILPGQFSGSFQAGDQVKILQ